MNMTNEEYGRYAARHMPRSRMGRNMLRAFLTGGAFIDQCNHWSIQQFAPTPARRKHQNLSISAKKGLLS